MVVYRQAEGSPAPKVKMHPFLLRHKLYRRTAGTLGVGFRLGEGQSDDLTTTLDEA